MNGIDPIGVPDSWEDIEDLPQPVFSGIRTASPRLVVSDRGQSAVEWDLFENALKIGESHSEAQSDLWPSDKIVISGNGADHDLFFANQMIHQKYTKKHAWGFEEGNIINGEYIVSKRIYPNSHVEEGSFVFGKLQGKGRITFSDGEIHEGIFEYGKLHGDGCIRYPDGRKEEGSFRHGELHGNGKRTLSDGEVHEGIFDDGYFSGKGSIQYPNGRRDEGVFRMRVLHGEGKITFPDGRKLEGMFENGLLHGMGKKTFSSGEIHEGMFEDEELTGKGCVVCPNGRKLEGMFRRGELHGKGKKTYPDGGISEGLFFNGYRVDSNISEIGSIQFFLQLFELTEGARDLGDPLGIVIDFLEQDGFKAFTGPLREVHERLRILEENLDEEAEKIYFELTKERRSKLLAYGCKGHAMGLDLMPDTEGKFIYCEIFNSGNGLRYHEEDERSGKYQTLLLVEVPIEHFNKNLIESLLNYRNFENAFEAYDVMLGLPEAVRILLSPELVVWQREQHTGNCTLEWIFAYLKNKISESAYYEMRFRLFKKCIEEVQKTEEGRRLLKKHSEKVFEKLDRKEQRCLSEPIVR